METVTEWTPWTPPYDPRQVDSSTVMEDEHGRLIETADCGQRCPGCGVCCNGYRDRIDPDFAGQDEYEGNLQPFGGLVKLEGGQLYRPASCGEACPGYACCCPPFGQRERPATVAQARQVLLEREETWRWQQRGRARARGIHAARPHSPARVCRMRAGRGALFC